MNSRSADMTTRTGETRPLSRIESRIPLAVDAYINYRNNYFVDARRFQAIGSGLGRDLAFSDGRLTRYGAWVARWTHWSLSVNQWTTNNGCDMPWARSPIEREYQRGMVDFIDDVHNRVSSVSSAISFRRWRPEVLDQVYFLNRWAQWVDDLSFERRMRNREFLYQSTFAGWHCKEVFAIPVDRRQDYYHPVTAAWRSTIELPAVYPTMSPWVYQYFSCYARRASRGVEES